MLSIVIPSWNGMAMLRDCLNSLRRQTWRTFEVIVVDDGSTDGTAESLADGYPEVVLERLETNSGFAIAVNRGIARAQGDWVLLLNNDVTLADDCLERLMAAATRGDAAMLSPLVLWTEDPLLVYSAGDHIGPNGRSESIGYMTRRDALVSVPRPFGVSGGYGMFRKDLLDDIGVLDPHFGAYFEDADLCFRARWSGYGARIVPDAIAWHVGGGSISGRTWWRTRQCYRNHALLVIKNFSIRMLIWNAPALLRERAHQAHRLFMSARHEWGALRALGYCVQAWLDLVLHVPGALAARRPIMRQRQISDRAMQTLLCQGDCDE